jgi:molecular chaperone GrpE
VTESLNHAEILSRFDDWLRNVAVQATAVGALAPEESPAEPLGLARVIDEFTALKHEVKLQTRSARSLSDEAASVLNGLRDAITHFRSVASKEDQALAAVGRPLAEALADVDDALGRAQAEAARVRARLVDAVSGAVADDLEAGLASLRWWQRLLVRRRWRAAAAAIRRAAEEATCAMVDPLLCGFEMIHARLRRQMQREQVVYVPCVGRPVDPERMTVVGLVDGSTAPAGTVLDEIRRGYSWRGGVLRYAEVRAAGAGPAPAGAMTDSQSTSKADGSKDPAAATT